MRIELRNDSILIDGYVNAVARDSRPVITERGKCVEQIMPGAFQKALQRAEKIDLLLNHNSDRKLGSTKENLELFEDNIGLRAICTISDSEVIEKARKGQLRGWSFGMHVNDDDIEPRAEGLPPRRQIKDLDIFEVSIIDTRMNPCYMGTTIEERSGADVIAEQRTLEARAVIVDNTIKDTVDYSYYENRIKTIKSC